MIYIFGDSWGFSYVKGDSNLDFVSGKCLSSHLADLGIKTINCCKRRLNNYEIVLKIKSHSITENDLLIVIQSDPIRDEVIDFPRDKKSVDKRDAFSPFIPTTKTFSLDDIIDDRLEKFYLELSNYNVILHTGSSKIHENLANRYKLKYFTKTATEIIIPEFEDSFLFDYSYSYKSSKFLEIKYGKQYDSIKSKKNLVDVANKMYVWRKYPEYFTNHHTTDLGTKIVAEYIKSQLFLHFGVE